MLYAEASYFDGYHFQHIAAYHEEQRIKRRGKQVESILRGQRERRLNGRSQLRLVK